MLGLIDASRFKRRPFLNIVKALRKGTAGILLTKTKSAVFVLFPYAKKIHLDVRLAIICLDDGVCRRNAVPCIHKTLVKQCLFLVLKDRL